MRDLYFNIRFLLAALCVALCGCNTFQGQGNLPQGVSVLLIDGAKIGITAELAPRIEKAYSEGKINYDVYLTMKEEERAALVALDNLRLKRVRGEDVTQEELNKAEDTFVTPLRDLVNSYIPVTVPEDQPKR